MSFPDPGLTASLYCAGHLDLLVSSVLRPVWRTVRAAHTGVSAYVWFMRYGRGGEHLKIRLHGPEEVGVHLAELLDEAAERYFLSLAAPEALPRSERWRRVPPVDAEDVADHPDRTLVWTAYSRSPICLGGEPFLHDDRWAALLTRCFAGSAEIALEALLPDSAGMVAHPRRMSALFRGLAAATAALDLAPPRRAAYLLYHRDALLRFLLLRCEDPVAKAAELLRRFAAHRESMGDAFRQLAGIADEQWGRGASGDDGDEPEASWGRALARLRDHAEPLCRDAEYHLDPFAPEPEFFPLFKAMHGLANHLGVTQLDEALAHHLLLQTTAPSSPGLRQVTLVPS